MMKELKKLRDKYPDHIFIAVPRDYTIIELIERLRR